MADTIGIEFPYHLNPGDFLCVVCGAHPSKITVDKTGDAPRAIGPTAPPDNRTWTTRWYFNCGCQISHTMIYGTNQMFNGRWAVHAHCPMATEMVLRLKQERLKTDGTEVKAGGRFSALAAIEGESTIAHPSERTDDIPF